jgi:sigma-B regulation protein RsbU (phosphoserine phosphatase)
MMGNENDPVLFLDVINRTIYDNVQRINSDKNLTLILLNYHNNCLRLSGQHESVIFVRASGEIELIDTMDLGFPIGLDEDIADFITEKEIHLNSGDGVVLYTDGITEAENEAGEFYELERLCEVIRQCWQQSSNEIKEAIIKDVRRHIGKQKVYDDITLLVIKQR